MKEKCGEERRGQGVCLFRWDSFPFFFKICSHFTELKKKVTGHEEAEVEKQMCSAEVGIYFQESGNVSCMYGCVVGFTVYV